MSNRRVKYTLIVAGAALLAAGASGSLIGGLNSSPLQAMQISWQPPAEAANPTATSAITPTPAKTATPQTARPTATPQPTLAPTAAPSVAPTDLPPVEGPTETPIIEYTVQRGDILKALATRFGTTPAAIIALNPQINPDSLTVGEVLRIPNAGTP